MLNLHTVRNKMSQAAFLGEIAQLIYNNVTLDGLLTHINHKYGFIKPYAAVKFYKELIKYTKSCENNLPTFTSDKKTYIIHITAWGSKYSQKIHDFLMPSLLAKNNLPTISKNYNIIFWVHCDKKSADNISISSAKSQIERYAKVRLDIIPKRVLHLLKRAKCHWLTSSLNTLLGYNSGNDWNYYILGCLQNIAMRAALKNKAFASIIMPDNLISDGALQTMFEVIKEKKVVVANMFRTSCEKIKSSITAKYNKEEYSLSLSTSFINDLMINNMHDQAQARIVSTKNPNFQVSNQLIFSYPQEIVIRSLIYHPILIDFEFIDTDIPSSYLPIDNLFMNNAINDGDLNYISSQIYVISGSYELGIMEISDNTDHNNIINDKEKSTKKSIDDIKKSINNMLKFSPWKPVNYFLFSKKYIYPISKNNKWVLSDISENKICNIDINKTDYDN